MPFFGMRGRDPRLASSLMFLPRAGERGVLAWSRGIPDCTQHARGRPSSVEFIKRFSNFEPVSLTFSPDRGYYLTLLGVRGRAPRPSSSLIVEPRNGESYVLAFSGLLLDFTRHERKGSSSNEFVNSSFSPRPSSSLVFPPQPASPTSSP